MADVTLRDDSGWGHMKTSAVMAPSATIVEALCNYAETISERLVQAARAEDAARLAEVERLVAGDDFDPQPWVRKADIRAALGVTAPTASEIRSTSRPAPTDAHSTAKIAESSAPMASEAPPPPVSDMIGARIPRPPAEASEVEGSDG